MSRQSAPAASVRRCILAPRSEVWAVLADGWVYPGWVVGASRMRAVAADYPAVGSALHHSVGSWPALLDDETRVVECEEGRRLVLEAKARPAGTAWVTLELSDAAGGSTDVEMREDVSGGPGLLMPKPVRQALIVKRNTETLLRLALLVERATAPASSAVG